MVFFLPIGGWTMPPIPPFRGTRNNHWMILQAPFPEGALLVPESCFPWGALSWRSPKLGPFPVPLAIKSTLKIARYCPLVIQGFSNFLGLFQVIMANSVSGSEWYLFLGGGKSNIFYVHPDPWGNDPYFSDGLVPPTSCCWVWVFGNFGLGKKIPKNDSANG